MSGNSLSTTRPPVLVPPLVAQDADLLRQIARSAGTPTYVYLVDPMLARVDRLRRAFANRFAISYSIKANPNLRLLRALGERVDGFDCSSIGEVELAMAAGVGPDRVSFCGPGKRPVEIDRAYQLGCDIVCESEEEIARLDQLGAATGRPARILLRINPRRVTRGFGINMAGRPSPFGFDEETFDGVLERTRARRHVEVIGLHIFSGSNSLDAPAIAHNFTIYVELFTRFAVHHDLRLSKLVFGAGFGIPYTADDSPLDLDTIAVIIERQLVAMSQVPQLAHSRLVLELGRFLVGADGYLLTEVVRAKHSRGTAVRVCDAGLHTALAACGGLGTVIRRDWRFWNLSAADGAEVEPYLLCGPLCTTIDVLALQAWLPRVAVGDVLALGSAGAYGPTASPTRFISHPQPKELLVFGTGPDAQVVDGTDGAID